MTLSKPKIRISGLNNPSSSQGRAHLESPRPVVDAIVLMLLIAVSLGSAWPIYETVWFALPVVAGVVGGAVIAGLAITRGWPLLKLVIVTALTYVVLGVPVAAPQSLVPPDSLGTRLIQVVLAPVSSWKELLSLELPLGTYEAVLAPVFLLALVCSVGAFSLAWRPGSSWRMAVPVGAFPMFFGILFGPGFVERVSVGPLDVSPSWMLGVAVLLLGFGWLAWRPIAVRRTSVAAAVGLLGEQINGRLVALKAFRVALGVAMVVAALVVSSLATGLINQGREREVLRDRVDPLLSVTSQRSPLTTYRNFFSNENFAAEMFSVQDSSDLERVRLATLSQYDGHTFTVLGDDGADADDQHFVRLPSRLDPSVYGIDGTGVEQAAPTVDIAGYEGIWVPVPGALVSVEFGGTRNSSLGDNFYFNKSTNTGVNLVEGGLRSGDRYTLDAYPYLLSSNTVADFTPAGEGRIASGIEVPESFTRWVSSQGVGTDGSALLELVSRLRSRGYLSHALSVEEQTTPAWVEALDDYTFIPSRSGHSLDRIDTMFTALLEQQDLVGVDAAPEMLVAAVGDDEQFAVAGALIADELGFNARIVLGARLLEPAGEDRLPTCSSGSCTGGDMAVWLEVQDGETGRWAAVDVTPQHETTPTPSEQQRSDPKHNTEVPEDTVLAIPPPQPKPVLGEEQAGTESEKAKDSIEVGRALRYAGISVLGMFVLASPFLTVVGAKTIRTVRRRRDPNPVHSTIGAWENYVDRGLDFGLEPPRAATRREVAEAFSPEDPYARYVADISDFATFGVNDPALHDPAPAWQASKRASTELSSRFVSKQRILALLSLRSFFGVRQAFPAKKTSLHKGPR